MSEAGIFCQKQLGVNYSAMISATIVGATGYTGAELIRLLLAHPQVVLKRVVSRSAGGKQIGEVLPHLSAHTDMTFSSDIGNPAHNDIVFFATPNGTAMTQAESVLNAGARMIDLAADFRLADAAQWQEWYGTEHSCPQLLARAVYGLPEYHRERIKRAQLIANPGCYPTTVILGFKPLLEAELIEPGCLVADCKSGVSGAGRSTVAELSYAECGGNFRAYKVAAHRHWPEIRNQLERIAGTPIDFSFTPHLLPIVRGMYSSLHFKTTASQEVLQACFERAYKDEPFVRVMEQGMLPEIRFVNGSNYCFISVCKQHNSHFAKVLVVIDNLLKGAAGQAVQNMNLMCSLDESTGLGSPPILP